MFNDAGSVAVDENQHSIEPRLRPPSATRHVPLRNSAVTLTVILVRTIRKAKATIRTILIHLHKHHSISILRNNINLISSTFPVFFEHSITFARKESGSGLDGLSVCSVVRSHFHKNRIAKIQLFLKTAAKVPF